MNKSRKTKALYTCILIAAIFLAAFSAYQLWKNIKPYIEAKKEYDKIASEFTMPLTDPDPTTAPTDAEEDIIDPTEVDEAGNHKTRGEQPPFAVNWEELQAVNPDVCGWIYVDALPNINYPIVKGETNDSYIHTSFEGFYLYSGTLFIDCANSKDWSDSSTIIYGHHMKNGGMFAAIERLASEEVFAEHPYFWILTPDGNYRYQLFSAGYVNNSDEVYTIYREGSPDFLNWEIGLKNFSLVESSLPLDEDDKVVILSTCAYVGKDRFVAIGKCVSDDVPVRKEPLTEDGLSDGKQKTSVTIIDSTSESVTPEQ